MENDSKKIGSPVDFTKLAQDLANDSNELNKQYPKLHKILFEEELKKERPVIAAVGHMEPKHVSIAELIALERMDGRTIITASSHEFEALNSTQTPSMLIKNCGTDITYPIEQIPPDNYPLILNELNQKSESNHHKHQQSCAKARKKRKRKKRNNK